MITSKHCSNCDTTKPVAEFYANTARSDGLSSWCVECQRAATTKSAHNIRAELVAALGGKCAKCEWTDPRALQVDHVNGGGGQERQARSVYSTSRPFVAHVLAHPGEYQLLCANHNAIKRIEEREHRKSDTYTRTIATERKATIGNGNGPGQRGNLKTDSDTQRRRSRQRWDAMTPEQRQAQSAKMRTASTGRRLVTGSDGRRHWSHPGDTDYPVSDTA